MILSYLPRRSCSRQSMIPHDQALRSSLLRPMARGAIAVATFAILVAGARAQVITIDTSGKNATTADGTVDRRYQQIQPTKVDLSKTEISPKTRIELLRQMQAEQGFAMRPLPRGHKGLKLIANGKLEPAGEPYLNMVVEEGLSAKPGDQVVITDVKFDHNKMIFELNGGPDLKHRILRHIELGGGMGTSPVVQDEGTPATGSRLTLEFKDHVPEMTGANVKALLAPLISFDVKTPIQAFTDTLPPQLKDAILTHQVLVGMSTDMVRYAKGQPDTKSREMDGQEPFEEWIYGKPPETVYFVRINGNRVIRLEIAKMGEPVQIFSTDVVSGMMRTDGTPVLAQNTDVHVVKEGDVENDPNRQAAQAPPSLANPGETVGVDGDQKSKNTMRPVQPAKPNPEYEPDVNPDQQQPAAPAQPASTQPASGQPAAPAQPASAPQPTQPPNTTPSSNFDQAQRPASAN
jgi:hypothetical protein